jgi:aminomethyltransferase
MSKRTPLYQQHLDAGAKITDFGGWDMPLHYGSQIDEHTVVRRAAGVFDVSHMTVVDVAGRESENFLARLLANDVAKLGAAGKGLYSCMLNDDGGVIDDLIVYRFAAGRFRLIVNAGTREGDLAWMEQVAADFEVTLQELTTKVMLAVQGPEARERAAQYLPAELQSIAMALGSFEAAEAGGVFVARTGYTGEDGWELVLDVAAGIELWKSLLLAGIAPCGLGARDTLRLEAGLNLYGQDMDAEVSPLECGLAWTVALDSAGREFVGRTALEQLKADGIGQKQVGLILEDRGIMRFGQRVITEAGDGVITSGSFSPTLQASVALARVPSAAADVCDVEIRNSSRRARIVKPPFVRNGKILHAINK